MKDEKQEEVKDGREESGKRKRRNRSSESGSGNGTEPTNGTTGTTEGSTGNEDGNGNSGEQTTESGEGTTGSKESAKRSLLERIRNKGNKGNPTVTDGEYLTTERDLQGTGNGNGTTESGITPISGTSTGHGGGTVTEQRETGRSNSNADNNSESSETENGRIRPRGVDISLPPIPTGTRGGNKPVTTAPNEEPLLTKTESKELKPRIEEALQIIFKYSDKFIQMTTKKEEARNVIIWGNMEKDEIGVLATFLVERGQKNKIMAGLSRKLSRDYQLLQVQILTLPRFYQMYMHYFENGFLLPFGKGK